MPKTKEELQQLKREYESLNNKLKELDEEELKSVTGGFGTKTVTYYTYQIGDTFKISENQAWVITYVIGDEKVQAQSYTYVAMKGGWIPGAILTYSNDYIPERSEYIGNNVLNIVKEEGHHGFE